MYDCPCCSNPTVFTGPKEDIGRICPICWWESDSFLSSDGEPSSRNHGLTLRKAREYYSKCGIADPERLIQWAEDDTRPWSQILLKMCEKAEAFEIHCWSDEREEIGLALQYGEQKDTGWDGGIVVAGRMTSAFRQMLSSLPKPAGREPYEKKTPFFSIFFDNGFSAEHYGTEINCRHLWD